MKWSIPVRKGYETLGVMQVPEQQSISSSSGSTAAADACSAANDCLAISDFKDSSSAAAAGSRWRCVASRRTELLLRWQCLLEERKQLTLLLQAEQGHCRLTDFEPGQSPVRDVTCAVVTHQFDLPCFSCCFQR
ncbi:hypothetical protein OEZ85_006697 [Tetradesmus obliquus]|uniref:Uncharacterized protein n=1 Tax=Tetradesmus obliquus TaxID=3088 RepID=A0ABY8TXV2_TETOB|nr:hypothetical protein OEZ85_006697 [Tetradesmus obliquus]